ncbi:hypothetical protein ACQKGL_18500 [Ensifer adhaerens]|uniref:hypothetical protein n=1 Tax=Ensifer adhaerens TaxID=106592 RepID=UPI003D06B28D
MSARIEGRNNLAIQRFCVTDQYEEERGVSMASAIQQSIEDQIEDSRSQISDGRMRLRLLRGAAG